MICNHIENAKPNKDKTNTESIHSTYWYSIVLMSYLIEHKPIQNRSFLSFKIPIQLVFEAKFKNSLKKSSFSSYRREDVFTNPENIFLLCFNFASNSRQNQNPNSRQYQNSRQIIIISGIFQITKTTTEEICKGLFLPVQDEGDGA